MKQEVPKGWTVAKSLKPGMNVLCYHQGKFRRFTVLRPAVKTPGRWWLQISDQTDELYGDSRYGVAMKPATVIYIRS